MTWRDRLCPASNNLRPVWVQGAHLGVVCVVGGAIMFVSGVLFLQQLAGAASSRSGETASEGSGLQWLDPVADAAEPFRSVGTYGLFSTVTKERPEIVVEGSLDGTRWLAYEFKHKPGEFDRRPGQVAPHQPRLDWQMWFAALGDIRDPSTRSWFAPFLLRLLQGSEPVLDLLAENPFPDAPPKYVRAVVYTYQFAPPQEKARSGQWWIRRPAGTYCPPVSLPARKGAR